MLAATCDRGGFGSVTVNVGVNYVAVIVAAIAAVAIGIVYYGILGVGDRQSRTLGISPGRRGPVQGAIGLIVGLVNAWVIAVLSVAVGAASISDAMVLGTFVWLGFGATFKAAQGGLRTAAVGCLGLASRSRPGRRSRCGCNRDPLALVTSVVRRGSPARRPASHGYEQQFQLGRRRASDVDCRGPDRSRTRALHHLAPWWLETSDRRRIPRIADPVSRLDCGHGDRAHHEAHRGSVVRNSPTKWTYRPKCPSALRRCCSW